MKEYENGERPDQLTTQTNAHPESTGQAREGGAVNTPLVFLLKQEVVDKLSPTELAEERASQTLEIMSNLRYLIATRQDRTGQDKATGEKLAPFGDSIKRIEMAYEIVAYPLLEDTRDGAAIREGVRDAQEHPDIDLEVYPHRAPIKLNEAEMGVLGTLALAAGLPHDPEKQVYSYTELIPRLDARSQAIMNSDKVRMIQQRMIDEGMLRKRSDIEKEIRKRQMSYVPKNKPSDPKK